MNVDNIFLSNAKMALANMVEKDIDVGVPDININNGSILIISCLTALEAYVNKIYISQTNITCYDQLKFEGKLKTLHNMNSKEIDWGQDPYQTVRELISIRNWLVHFKDSFLGKFNPITFRIVNKEGKSIPVTKDPFEIFTKERCLRYYNETKSVMLDLAHLTNLDIYDYEFITTENFDFFTIG